MEIGIVACNSFKSFGRNGAALDYTQYPPGLYYATGENRDEPQLGSNGAGKSTFFVDALLYTLFGRTARGEKIVDHVSTAPEKEGALCMVKVGSTVVIRQQRGNTSSVFLNPQGGSRREVTQNTLNDTLGLNWELFTNTVVLSQLSPRLLLLPPSAKVSLLSQALGLDDWLEASEDAKGEVSASSSKLARVTERITQLRARQDELGKETLEKAKQDWEVDRDRKLRKLDLALSTAELRRDRLERLQVKLERKLRTRETAVAATERVANARMQRVNRLEKEANTARVEEAKAQEHEYNLKERYNKVVGGRCETCGVYLDQPIVQSVLAAWQASESEVIKAREVRISTVTELRRMKKQLAEVEQRLDQRAKLQLGAAERFRFNKEGITGLSAEVASLTGQIADMRKETNPFEGSARDAQERYQSLAYSIALAERAKDILERKRGGARYWTTGFKRVRSMMLEEVLAALEVETNSYAGALGLGNWQVRYRSSRETKAGTTSYGFEVLVEGPDGSTRPALSWSGGETQRLALACQMGFASMLSDRTGLSCNIEIWDEPTSWLSVEGVDALLTALSYRASRLNKRIWVVDQREVETHRFAGMVRVIKERGEGSRLEFF